VFHCACLEIVNFGVLYKSVVIIRLKIYGESVWLLDKTCHNFEVILTVHRR